MSSSASARARKQLIDEERKKAESAPPSEKKGDMPTQPEEEPEDEFYRESPTPQDAPVPKEDFVDKKKKVRAPKKDVPPANDSFTRVVASYLSGVPERTFDKIVKWGSRSADVRITRDGRRVDHTAVIKSRPKMRAVYKAGDGKDVYFTLIFIERHDKLADEEVVGRFILQSLFEQRTPCIITQLPKPGEVIPVVDYTVNEMHEGARTAKYHPHIILIDTELPNGTMENDILHVQINPLIANGRSAIFVSKSVHDTHGFGMIPFVYTAPTHDVQLALNKMVQAFIDDQRNAHEQRRPQRNTRAPR